jgi:hypothetical protein
MATQAEIKPGLDSPQAPLLNWNRTELVQRNRNRAPTSHIATLRILLGRQKLGKKFMDF